MRFTRILMAATAAVALSTAFEANADTPHQDSAKTSQEFTTPHVLDTRGNCVRTRWENGSDICAEPMAVTQKPRPRIMPAQLSKEETVVYFNFDKSNVTPSEAAKLDRVAMALRNAERIVDARVVGYADPIGGSNYNLNLSQRRVNAVQAYLEGKGVRNSEAVDVRAMGETNQFADCTGLKGDAVVACFRANRRVELKFDYK